MIASERGEVGFTAGMELLKAGASAMDAVEAAVRVVEANEADHYVGVGGLPNLLGVVELDASIMDGATRKAGAVAAVTGFPHPISIARAVCDRLPQHLLLVGAGAEQFAAEAGIERGETLTDEAKRMWREGLGDEGLARAAANFGPGEVEYRRQALHRIAAMVPPQGPWGTVNVLALDAAGNLACAVSTSGYPWKYPGRVGDSALIGAGNYCDNRYGAAACTGRGELAIRSGTARCVVAALQQGADPARACASVLADTADLGDEFRAPLQVLCLTPDGRHAAAATKAGSTYSVISADDDTFAIIERQQI
ncbi:MAG TPA: isoaspartyl peptidase/L-asparaginase [Streptosporangiaceae bacterium]|jgi:beta-aspartyl-peptidase (threonine type)|nr:isoaspartyl peptidase/L-asparaginase [Streptosporangiaceae bacterium]